MTAEELEELLAPQVAPQQSIPKSINATALRFPLERLSTTNYITPGQYTSDITINVDRHRAPGATELSSENKETIMTAIIAHVNLESRGIRCDQNELQGLSRRITAYVESYMYQRFPYMIHPKIKCNFNMLPWDFTAAISITINDVHIGTMGIKMR